MKRLVYRARQFWWALTAQPDPGDLAEVQQHLSPAQYVLFRRLQPSEQAHAIAVFKQIREQESHPDLLVASLLHDIGKVLYPLSVWQRVSIVLLGSKAGRVGMVAEKHPEWGADLAKKAGASPLAVRLIRRHQDAARKGGPSKEDRLLAILQAADDAY